MEPLGPPPSSDDIWVPPCRYWYEGHYILRSGYWLRGQPDWVWIPSHYTWTPRGYVFVPGHWDYALERRGVLFAPVLFPRHFHARPAFSYRLSVVVDLGLLRVNLFTYPRYSHYCFGDWYDDAYLRVGIYPRWQSERIRVCYDPIYHYDRWRHVRTEPHWVENERHQYDLRRADRDLRPPRTYHEMEVRQAKLPELQRRNLQIAQPLNRVVARRTTPLKFEPVSSSEQKKITRQATDVRKFGDQRTRWESPAVSRRTVGPLTERKEIVKPPAEHKEPTVGSPERKAPASPPVEHKEPTVGPRERKAPTTPPVASTPAERKATGPVPAEHAPPFVSPREVKMTKPETVRIPRPPIIGRAFTPSRQEVGTPSNPTAERQNPRDLKGRITDRSRNKGKDEERAR